jgi:hypothetical protein
MERRKVPARATFKTIDCEITDVIIWYRREQRGYYFTVRSGRSAFSNYTAQYLCREYT